MAWIPWKSPPWQYGPKRYVFSILKRQIWVQAVPGERNDSRLLYPPAQDHLRYGTAVARGNVLEQVVLEHATHGHAAIGHQTGFAALPPCLLPRWRQRRRYYAARSSQSAQIPASRVLHPRNLCHRRAAQLGQRVRCQPDLLVRVGGYALTPCERAKVNIGKILADRLAQLVILGVGILIPRQTAP